MLTDKKIPGKLEKIIARYGDLRFEHIADVPVQMCETRAHYRDEPGADAKLKWRAAAPGLKWGDSWVTAWFRGDVAVPKEFAGRKVFIRARTGGAEGLFIVDNVHRGVFDTNHPVRMMALKADVRREYHISIEAYAGHTFPGTQPHDTGPVVEKRSQVFEGVELVSEREDVTAFTFDLAVLVQLMQALDENSLRRNRILAGLSRVFEAVDAMPAERPEDSWRPRIAKARKIMKPLLDAKNGPTAPQMSIIGHSHIDTAWLWTLDETWRKCARTFSSILNLMEQYPEFVFIQTAPCHTEMMRREYPGIFKRIQKAVKAGKWEPNGAMWVEPDCNLVSGESFVRQLLVGQTATREMFGYTSNMMWMPDVFGYSAALPQILRQADVEYFCTTKIAWNDTTRFPYDTFVWKGIDGSEVIAHYNSIHCWPDPKTLAEQWNWVQHKDVQDRRLCAFGFGDGGGGPQAEMIEVARRVEDIEGCPRASYTTVGDFMDGIRDEIPGLPEWCGELYLEAHRGTLTSIAKIKRGNRKAEFALRDAELLCTLAALKGAKYPAGWFQAIWKELLMNQFHDILPGSSIAEVNDAAIVAFDRMIQAAAEMSAAAMLKIGGGRSSTRMLLVNSLSWDRTGEMVLNGAPEGSRPADPDVAAQVIESILGEKRLVIEGATVPALGAAVLELAGGAPEGISPFEVRGNRVGTPHAKVRFDRNGHIVSFVDRASGRELVKPGGALNVFISGEDIPEQWDNWDVDSDQWLKMRTGGALIKSEVVADGPLQLRIRQHYIIGEKSALRQDIVFHATSPQVDFETVIDWDEKHRLLKAGFALDVMADTARHEIQYGHVERPTHQNLPCDRARFEVCAHKWTDLSDNGFGVAILNDCKYGVSVFGSEVALTLIKSGTHPDARGDGGRHRFTYALLPHACPFSVEAVVRPAYELNVPVVAGPASSKAEGFEGIVSADAPNVIVEAVKWAEKGDAFIVRLYDAGKIGRNVTVTFNAPVKAVAETNLLEEKPKKLRLSRKTVKLFIKPFEIKTLRCEVKR